MGKRYRVDASVGGDLYTRVFRFKWRARLFIRTLHWASDEMVITGLYQVKV